MLEISGQKPVSHSVKSGKRQELRRVELGPLVMKPPFTIHVFHKVSEHMRIFLGQGALVLNRFLEAAMYGCGQPGGFIADQFLMEVKCHGIFSANLDWDGW
jgi:hypothetical protein